MHWKPVDVPRALEMCRIVNANRSARVIVGLSRCGLAGDNDIRLKALKPGGGVAQRDGDAVTEGRDFDDLQQRSSEQDSVVRFLDLLTCLCEGRM